VNIRRRHTLGIQEAKTRVDRVAAQLGDKFGLRAAWDGDDLKFRGSGVDGQIRVAEDEVEAQLRLGLSLKLLEGNIRSAIDAAMDEHLL
jgi:putative polyhydroxyalkanoate system protein